MFFHPKNLKSENYLNRDLISVDSQCIEYLGYITLPKYWFLVFCLQSFRGIEQTKLLLTLSYSVIFCFAMPKVAIILCRFICLT